MGLGTDSQCAMQFPRAVSRRIGVYTCVLMWVSIRAVKVSTSPSLIEVARSLQVLVSKRCMIVRAGVHVLTAAILVREGEQRALGVRRAVRALQHRYAAAAGPAVNLVRFSSVWSRNLEGMGREETRKKWWSPNWWHELSQGTFNPTAPLHYPLKAIISEWVA